MQIKIEKRANRIVAFCSGKIDNPGAVELEEVLHPLIKKASMPIDLDMSDVYMLASAGIRSLIFLFKESSNLSDLTLLRIINPSETVNKVLEISGLMKNLTSWNPKSNIEIKSSERSYFELLEKVRLAFPAPVSNPIHDAYFVQSIARGLNKIDDLKTEKPYLGERVKLDFDSALKAVIPEKMSTLEKTIDEIADYLQGLVIFGHPRTQENVGPPPSIASIIGQLYCSIYNPNIISDEASHRISQAEVELASICADLVGYDRNSSAGFSTFGGTGTVLYGTKLGIEKACPGTFQKGIDKKLKVIASDVAHYAKFSVMGWLGLGTDNLVLIPTDSDNSMDLAKLEDTLRELISSGQTIACIIASMGTTDAFGIDNLEYIVNLRNMLVEEYKLDYLPHVHADSVIGWAWAVFNDYDFDNNPMEFSPRTLRSLWDTRANMAFLHLADSCGIDFHKTGYGPYISSLFLCKNKKELEHISRDKTLMPYLFQYGNYHPGIFTLETSRSGGSILSALANMKMLGKEGYRTLLGHIVSMAEILRNKIENSNFACLVNNYNYGPVTLFRVYPDEISAPSSFNEEISDKCHSDKLLFYNDYNRKIFNVLNEQMEEGRGMALSLTERYRVTQYGEPILAIKSYVMSPFVDEEAMNHLMNCIQEARSIVGN